MLIVKKGVQDSVIVTITETMSSSASLLQFHFTHRGSGETIDWTFSVSDDVSPSKTRYNQFTIPAHVLGNAPTGFYLYTITEGSTTLETGALKLTEDKPDSTIYDGQQNDYVIYE